MNPLCYAAEIRTWYQRKKGETVNCHALQVKKKKKERLFCLSDQLNQNINTKCCKLPMREWWSSTHTHGFPRNRCRKTKSGRSGGRRLYARPQRPQKKLFQTRYKMTYNTLFLRKVSKWYAAETGCRIGMLIEEKVQRSMKHFIVDTLIFARCIEEYCSCLVTWLQCCTQTDQQRQRSMFSKESWYLCFRDAYHLMLCPAAGGLSRLTCKWRNKSREKKMGSRMWAHTPQPGPVGGANYPDLHLLLTTILCFSYRYSFDNLECQQWKYRKRKQATSAFGLCIALHCILSCPEEHRTM